MCSLIQHWARGTPLVQVLRILPGVVVCLLQKATVFQLIYVNKQCRGQHGGAAARQPSSQRVIASRALGYNTRSRI